FGLRAQKQQMSENTLSGNGSNGRAHPRTRKAALPKRGATVKVPAKAEDGEPVISRFYGTPMPGVVTEDLSGSLIVIEGTDGSGRSTQISLLTEWLESEGFAVQTMGLRRSYLVGEDIDALLAENAVTRMTLALMYGTDFF